jgi:hypothetical protein
MADVNPSDRDIADQLVNDWDAAGEMPQMAWDFRGFAVEAMRRARELDRAATLDAGGDELCGCGRPAEYSTNDGGRCCNKYGVRCPPAPAGDAVALVRGSWLHTSDVLTLEQITSARYTLNDERLPADVRDYLRGLAGRIPNVPTAALNPEAV